MKKKKKLLLLLCLIISMLNVTKAKADSNLSLSFGQSGEDSSGGSLSGGKNNGFSSWIYFTSGKKRMKYRYSVQYSASTNYNIRTSSPNGETIKAGTWMGINANEIQSASWNVSAIEYKEVKKVYTCTIQRPSTRICPCYHVYSNGGFKRLCEGDAGFDYSRHCTWQSGELEDIIRDEKRDYYDSSPCPPGSIEKVKEEESDISASQSIDKSHEVYSIAHNTAISLVGAPLSKLQIITDDIDKNKEHRTETIQGQLISSSDSGIGKSGAVSKTYSYKPSNICINLKTGKVSYNKECQNDNEAKLAPYINNNIEYWQYFSPLETKSGTNHSIIIKNNAERKLSDKECHSIMNNYKNQYQNYIVSINNKTLKGDYCRNGNCNNLNTGSSSDWQEVSNGCYISTIVNFDVIQKFYFEEKKNGELKFNGYNIYYRPINIDNPFPNVPTKNSIWYEWYNSDNKTPNFNDSFNEIAYSVNVSNQLAETIRTYNTNNPYPSFDNISLTGKSNFLQIIGVQALVENNKYKLGEGTKACIKNNIASIGSGCS